MAHTTTDPGLDLAAGAQHSATAQHPRMPWNWTSVALLTYLLICWSSSFIGMCFSVDYASVSQVLLWRSFISTLILLPIGIGYGPPLRLRSTLIEGFVVTFTMAGYMGSCIVAIGRGVGGADVGYATADHRAVFYPDPGSANPGRNG